MGTWRSAVIGGVLATALQTLPCSADPVHLGRYVDGYNTPFPGQGFLIGNLDADPRADILSVVGGELTFWTLYLDGRLIVDGTIPVNGPFVPFAQARFNDDAWPDLLGTVNGAFRVLDGTPGGYVPTPRPMDNSPLHPGIIGDVDGDGIDDLVVQDEDTLISYLNRGDQFAVVSSLIGPTAYGPMRMGDLDGDGDLDAVMRQWESIRTARNIGSGHYESWAVYDPPGYSDVLVVEDLDNDGRQDMATTHQNGLTVLWNDPGAPFVQRTELSTPIFGADFLTAADVDQNGTLDLVSAEDEAEWTNTRIHLNHGGRNFAAGPSCFSGAYDRDLAGLGMGDFDGDGLTDIAVLNAWYSGTREVTVHRGRLGSMPGQRAYAHEVGDYRDRVWSVNYGAHERDDVVLVSPDSAVYIPTKQDGTLGTGIPFSEAAGFDLIDISGDGKKDLVKSGQGMIVIRKWLHDLVFTAPETLPYGDLAATGDFNGDGVLDLLSTSNGAYRTLPGTGGGHFGTPGPDLLPESGVFLAVASADLNGDGLSDLAITQRDEPYVYRLRIYQSCDGEFLLWNNILLTTQKVYADPRELHFIRLDGDDAPDLAIVWSDGSDGQWIQMARGSGAVFTFVDSVEAGMGEVHWNTFADLDDDGLDDFIMSSSTSLGDGQIMVWHNLGARFDNEDLFIQAGGQPAAVAIGDFNGDGFRDLADAVHRYDDVAGYVTLHLNRGVPGIPVSTPEKRPIGTRASLLLRSSSQRFTASPSFVVTSAGREPIEIGLYDLQGRQLGRSRFQPLAEGQQIEVEIPTATPLPAGVYWGSATQAGARATSKVVRLR